MRADSESLKTKDISRALRRAARRALELGLKTGTPVYVMKNGKIVDLTKDKAVTTKRRSKRTSKT
jgi:hypothetical protein